MLTLLCLTLLNAPVVTASDAPLAQPKAVLTPQSSSAFQLSGLDRDQLWGLRLDIEADRPGFLKPALLLGGGLLSATAGAGLFAAGVLTRSFANGGSGAIAYASAGSALTVLGGGLAVWGLVALNDILKERRLSGLKLDAIEERLDAMNASGDESAKSTK